MTEEQKETLQGEFDALRAAIRKFIEPIMDKLEIWVIKLNEWIGGNR